MAIKSFIIDTSAWIFVLRKGPIPQLKDRIDFLLGENHILTTGIIKLELLGGTRNKKEYLRLKNRLTVLDDVKTDDALWGSAYELAFNLRRKGITVPYTDIIIAACTHSANAVLLHADAHFDLISKHTGLPVESYVDMVVNNTH